MGGLKVAWQGSYRAPGVNDSLQNAPICCPSGLMYQVLTAGAVAINPGDGTVAWEYKGVAYNTDARGDVAQRPASSRHRL